jgi:LytS/YehU family sensor histidine kinase
MLIFVFGMAPLAWYEIAKHLRMEEIIRQKIDKDRLEALLKLKETELKLLKSQIHPHFLFNTLNNLYSLALEKSDRTPDLIIRLSDMLSYIIYDCKSEKVPLSKEIDFIKNYIELQKVRYENCDIEFAYNIDLGNKLIAPMILHTFIDNSFKHGAENDMSNPWIKIFISSNNGSLFLSVINSVCDNGIPGNQGIGIINTKKRLDLIYRDKHQLVMHKSVRKFAVFLKMQL